MSDSALTPQPADPYGVMQLALWTPTSLVLPEDMTFDAWQAVGDVLGQAERSVQWWMGDWWRYGEHKYGERAAQALDSRWDYGTWRNAGWVAGAIETSRRRDSLSWSHHYEVASLPPEEADTLLDQAEAEAWSVVQLRAAKRRAKAGSTPLLPDGRYAVLLADPPWRYDFVEAPNRAIENQYPTMATDEIAAMAIADIAADDAVLFLWATNPKLLDALAVVEGWGFRYTTNLAWVKDRIGMGYWARQRHELLLVATRGDMAPPPEHLRPDSVIEAPRRAHSAKPPAIHELIEAIWPDAPKVELFARQARSGWAVFGNQIGEAA